MSCAADRSHCTFYFTNYNDTMANECGICILTLSYTVIAYRCYQEPIKNERVGARNTHANNEIFHTLHIIMMLL